MYANAFSLTSISLLSSPGRMPLFRVVLSSLMCNIYPALIGLLTENILRYGGVYAIDMTTFKHSLATAQICDEFFGCLVYPWNMSLDTGGARVEIESLFTAISPQRGQ
jgi:hypothetical protein